MPNDTDALAAAVRGWALATVAAREISSALLARRLADKAARRWPEHEPAARRAAVEAAVAFCIGHGLVDDARFADISIRGGAARGHSRRRIAATLAGKGVAGAGDLAAVDEVAGALRLLRRRRLGPWVAAGRAVVDAAVGDDGGAADDAGVDAVRRGWGGGPRRTAADRALALLLRNGFPAEVARRALAMTRDEAERYLDAPG